MSAPSRDERSLSTVIDSIKQLWQGRSDAVGTVTLRAGFTTTTVTRAVDKAAINVAQTQQIFLAPKTANAAAALATTYVSAIGQGTFTLTHANAVSTDRTFAWEARG